MAVIITDMDMPKSCGNCRFITARNGCIANEKAQIISFREVSDDCPLKSADEMIAEMECVLDYWDMNNNTAIKGLKQVINKYCDKGAEQ